MARPLLFLAMALSVGACARNPRTSISGDRTVEREEVVAVTIPPCLRVETRDTLTLARLASAGVELRLPERFRSRTGEEAVGQASRTWVDAENTTVMLQQSPGPEGIGFGIAGRKLEVEEQCVIRLAGRSVPMHFFVATAGSQTDTLFIASIEFATPPNRRTRAIVIAPSRARRQELIPALQRVRVDGSQ